MNWKKNECLICRKNIISPVNEITNVITNNNEDFIQLNYYNQRNNVQICEVFKACLSIFAVNIIFFVFYFSVLK